MANTACSLVYFAKLGSDWKRFPVLMSKNGRVRTGWVMVDGVETHLPGGRFQIRTYKGRKPEYTNAGTDAAEALALRDRMAKRAKVVAQAEEAGVAVVKEDTRKLIRTEANRFIQRCKDTDANEAAVVYRKALDNFIEAVDVQYVDEVREETMVQFGAFLRKQGNGARTIFNKHRGVLTFLRWCDVDVKSLKIRTPKFERKMPVIYTDEQIDRLKAVSDPYFSTVIDVLRMCGLREMEAVHLEWRDIDFARKLVLVRSKPKWKHSIKDKEERDVPLPEKLAAVLRAWRDERDEKQMDRELVLGTDADRPQVKWLRLLKRAARDAGLNCGRCDSCVSLRECSGYTLHSFRRTYATSLSRSGVDMPTLMNFLGHSDVETTMGYLRPMQAEAAHPQVNAAFA